MDGSLMNIDVFLGKKVRAAIEQSSLERSHIAKALRVRAQDLTKMESGEVRISARVLHQISKLTEMDISWFFDTNINGGSSFDGAAGSNTHSRDDWWTALHDLRLNKTLSDLCEAAKGADLPQLKTAKVA